MHYRMACRPTFDLISSLCRKERLEMPRTLSVYARFYSSRNGSHNRFIHRNLHFVEDVYRHANPLKFVEFIAHIPLFVGNLETG